MNDDYEYITVQQALEQEGLEDRFDVETTVEILEEKGISAFVFWGMTGDAMIELLEEQPEDELWRLFPEQEI